METLSRDGGMAKVNRHCVEETMAWILSVSFAKNYRRGVIPGYLLDGRIRRTQTLKEWLVDANPILSCGIWKIRTRTCLVRTDLSNCELYELVASSLV
jgi:hypothetical protein